MKPPLKPPKHVDAIGRRHRTKRQATGEPLELTPRLLEYLRFIRRCRGPVPANMTFAAWSHDGRGRCYFPKVSKRLFHERVKLPDGSLTDGPLIDRPGELNPDKGVKAQPAWIELTDEGTTLVANEELGYFNKRDPLQHRGMGACMEGSSILLAPEYGMRHLDLARILQDKRTPAATKALTNPLVIQTKRGSIEPDGAFGYEYIEKGAFRFFLREDSRRTEPRRRDPNAKEKQQSEIEKILKYEELLSNQLFRIHFGLPNMRIMWCMTSEGRKDGLLNFLAGRPHADKHLFKVFNQFSREHWDAPREPLSDLFDEPWETVNGPFDISKI